VFPVQEPTDLRVALVEGNVDGWNNRTTRHRVEVTDFDAVVSVPGTLNPLVEPVEGGWTGLPDLEWSLPEGTTSATLRLYEDFDPDLPVWLVSVDPRCADQARYPDLLPEMPVGATPSLRVRAEVGDTVVTARRVVLIAE